MPVDKIDNSSNLASYFLAFFLLLTLLVFLYCNPPSILYIERNNQNKTSLKMLRSGRNRYINPPKKVGRRKKPKWVDLPWDITADILKRLDVADILDSAQKVCTTWRSLCMEPSMFRKIHFSLSPYRHLSYQILGSQAVDRSQGQLQDISIPSNCDALFLDYVAQRSPKLRCLEIRGCRVTGEDVVEAVKKFPLLEELQLIYIPFTGELIEKIGRCCPLLKSFTLHREGGIYFWEDWDESCDTEALAIAKTMPGLRHLSLLGNQMCNEALVGILDGCVNLESLDLRVCSNIDLRGDLGDRCSRQIKSFKNDSNYSYHVLDFCKYFPDLDDLFSSDSIGMSSDGERSGCHDLLYNM